LKSTIPLNAVMSLGHPPHVEEPHDVFRRHDNCGCMTTYENGRQRQDVWSKKSWEVPSLTRRDSAPARLSTEQARQLQVRNLSYRGLTNGGGSDIIETSRIHAIGDAESELYETNHSFDSRVTQDVRKAFNEEYQRAVEMYGEIDTISGIDVMTVNSTDEGSYNDNSRWISLRHAEKKNGLKIMAAIAQEKFRTGKWSTSNPRHAMRHEIGHAIQLHHRLYDDEWQNKLYKYLKYSKSH